MLLNKFKKSTQALLAAGALVLALGLAVGCSRGGTVSRSSDGGNDALLGVTNIRQIVAANNKTDRTITWQTDHKQKFALEIREAGSKSIKELPAKETSFQDVKSQYLQYTSSLNGLQAGKSYEYRLVAGQTVGKWHKLHTDNGKSFKALIFPDAQCTDYSVWQNLASNAYGRNKDADFYINMGDLVDNGQDKYQWTEWFKGVATFSDSVPIAPMIGNHEAYSLDWKFCLPVSYTHLFQVPATGMPEKYKNQFYSFDYGPVHFTVLDTNYDTEMKELQPELRADQLAWLEQDLAKSTAKWKIVLQHKDIVLYTFSKDSGRPIRPTAYRATGTDVMPIYEKYKVDAVLSAHLHTYRRRQPLLNFKPAANPKEGILYILTGVAGNIRYAHIWGEWDYDAATAPKPETDNYMTMEVTEDKITFKAFLPDGKQFDEVSLTK